MSLKLLTFRNTLGRNWIPIVFAISQLFSMATATAGEPYPLPYDNTPDWRGFGTDPPPSEARILGAPVFAHFLAVVVIDTTKIIDQDSAAKRAYKNLFDNEHHLPPGAGYVAFIIYGPANALGVHTEFAYVFARDTSNRWHRRVSEKELTAIECAIGRCPNL
jgi:hypothetical protein